MSEDDFQEWLLHPVTVEFRKAMQNKLDELKNDWAAGVFTTESVDGSKQLNSEAIGKAWMLEALLETTYQSVTEDAANGK